MRRLLAPVLVATTMVGCAGPATWQDQRAQVLSQTCVSFAERRYGTDLDRAALLERAAPEDFRAALDDGDRAGVQVLLERCRPERRTR